MKRHRFPCRWTVLLLLTAFLAGGCKILDPRTWTFKSKPRNAQRVKYEAATPYAGLAPVQGERLVAVSGMGYNNSMAFFTPDGRRIVSESVPVATEDAWLKPGAGAASPPAAVDKVRRERFGQSFAETRIGAGDAPADSPAPEKPAPPPDPFAGLPTGNPVPGKAGFVNLPEPYSGLPEIDVRGIPPGTPVEVPNPFKAGDKIRFRVP